MVADKCRMSLTASRAPPIVAYKQHLIQSKTESIFPLDGGRFAHSLGSTNRMQQQILYTKTAAASRLIP